MDNSKLLQEIEKSIILIQEDTGYGEVSIVIRESYKIELNTMFSNKIKLDN